MQVRSCRFRLWLHPGPAPVPRGGAQVQLSRASINNARRSGHPMSPLLPAPQGLPGPKRSYWSRGKSAQSGGLAQADHRHLEPPGLSKSQPQFLHLQSGVDNCASLCKGACVRSSDIHRYSQRRTLQALHRDTKVGWAQVTCAWSGVGTRPETAWLPLCVRACSARAALGSAWLQSPALGLQSLGQFWTPAPACAECVTGSAGPPGTQASGRCLVSAPSQQPRGSGRSPVCTIAEVPWVLARVLPPAWGVRRALRGTHQTAWFSDSSHT